MAAFALLLISFLGLPAPATAMPLAPAPVPDPTPTPPPPCVVDSDGDGFVLCDGVCDPGSNHCDIDDGDSRIYPGAPCGLCNGNCPISGFCVPGSTHLPCPDPTNGGLGRDETHSFCMNVNSSLIGVCSNSSAHCFSNADCPGGTCNSVVAATGAGLTANPDGTNPICAPIAHPIIWQAEGGSGETDAQRRVDPTCLDNTDNDCDGLPDVLDPDCQTPEICDGKDNNGNGLIDEGLHVGEPCSVGIGACEAHGVNVCKGDGTTAVVCNAVAKAPQREGPFGDPSCYDGIDNNCDGHTDFPNPITNPNGDKGCTEPEVCDGLDNDGDGVIDNGFDVGAPCSVGVGACAATGVKVCSADGKGTVCNAVAKLPGIEGPSVPGSCSDGIDNDCDGLVDAADPSCGTANFRITCALPFEQPPGHGRGSPGKDCNSTNIIKFDEPAGVQVMAELLALDPKGTVIASKQVHNGESVHIASRVGTQDFRFDTVVTGPGLVKHTVFAPMPMLKVTASNGLQKTTAYCTTDPFLHVVQPAGGVVSVSKSAQGSLPDATRVLVAMPEVSPASLVVLVDGVSLFPLLGKTGADCGPATPCNGDVTINGASVHVDDLVVDVGSNVGDPASNTMSMSLVGLGCGGHVLSVSGKKIPGSIPDKVTSQCLVDDLADKATSYTFTVDITSPVNQSNNNPVPTHVAGKVCHGLPISAVSINGKEIFDPTKMTITPNPPPPPGADTAAKFEFPIGIDVGQTSLARDIVFGDAPVGTFDPGSNILQAAATDAMGNRVFNNSVVFATGDHVVNPGAGSLAPTAAFSAATGPQVKTALQGEIESAIHDAVKDISLQTASTIDVPNAFVVALDATALSNFFAEKCKAPGLDGKTITQRFQELANANILGKTFPPGGGVFHAPSLCSCDPPFRLTVNHVDFLSSLACPVFFPGQTDSFGGHCANDPDPNKVCRTSADCSGGAACNRPPVPDNTIRVVLELPDISAGLSGGGWCKETFLGVCIDEATVSVSVNAEVRNVRLKFDITEAQLMGTVKPGDPTFTAGIAATVEPSLHAKMDVGCIGGDICTFIVETLLPGIGTLLVEPDITLDQTFDFARELGQFKQDPIELHPIKLDEEKIANFGQTVKGNLVDVNISPQGIRASLTGRFSTDFVDPEVVKNPGAFLEFPPTPELPIASGQDGAVMVNADSINMMFASLTLSGHLKSECQTSDDPANPGHPRTVASLLPADCNSINPPNAGAAALARGFCFGLKGADCEALASSGNFLDTALEQGTCHGLKGDNCATITSGFAGLKMPSDCSTLSVGATDTGDPTTATDLVQGWCAGLNGANCEAITGGTAVDVATRQGACHGAEGHNCATLPTGIAADQELGACAAVQGAPCTGLGLGGGALCILDYIQLGIINGLVRFAEQGSCGVTSAVNVRGNDTLLFCARQDLPPHFVIRDDASTPPVEVGLRLNDLSVAVVLDRNGATPGSPPNGQLDGTLASTPPCLGPAAVQSGDCTLAALCLDLNFVASFELAGGECPLEPGGLSKPGFKVAILGVQPLSRVFGQVCSGMPTGDDAKFVSESATNNASIDTLQLNSQTFSPPACMSGLTLGGFVTFENPKIFALATGAPKSVCSNDSNIVCTSNADCGGNQCVPIQNYIGISTKILP